MSQPRTSELENYVRRIGENIVDFHAKLNELDRKICGIEQKFDEVKDDLTNNVSTVSELKENSVQKQEFEEFIRRLTESFKELPSLSAETEEEKKEETPEQYLQPNPESDYEREHIDESEAES